MRGLMIVVQIILPAVSVGSHLQFEILQHWHLQVLHHRRSYNSFCLASGKVATFRAT
jgi:hypothetical protein